MGLSNVARRLNLSIDMNLNCYTQKYVERVARLDGRLPDIPVFIFTEGNEPTFFTSFFSWDPSKVNVSVIDSSACPTFWYT